MCSASINPVEEQEKSLVHYNPHPWQIMMMIIVRNSLLFRNYRHFPCQTSGSPFLAIVTECLSPSTPSPSSADVFLLDEEEISLNRTELCEGRASGDGALSSSSATRNVAQDRTTLKWADRVNCRIYRQVIEKIMI